MSKHQTSSTPICDRCGKQLKYFACIACGGKGYKRELIFFKKECSACSGSGKILRCPEEYQHIKDDLDLSSRIGIKSLYRNFQKNDVMKISLKPPTQRTIYKQPGPLQVPPPWHSSYPNPWHPLHPRNPRNQPFNPLNPNSPTNPNNPLNPNNPGNRNPFK